MTTYYSPEGLELRVGPGTSDDDPKTVRFQGGFAEIALDDPLRADKLRWIAHARRTYPIEEIGEDRAGLTIPGLADGFQCHLCSKTFERKAQLTGHFLSHKKAGDWIPPVN